MYASSSNPIDATTSKVTVPPQARITPPENFRHYLAADYIPLGLFNRTGSEKWIVHANADYAHGDEVLEENFESKEKALNFADLQSNTYPYRYRYAVIVEDGRIKDIYHGKGWMEYRVLPSKVNDGWVHGFPGDHDHQKGGPKDVIIEGATEVVIEDGYNRLLIEDQGGNIEAVWPNCFLTLPESPLDE